MARALERPISFGRSSHVRTYWLLHSEGFRVRGRRLRGTVEAVHGPPSEARALVVRHGVLGRRIVLPADAVERVVPAEELLVVESVQRPGGGRRRSLDHALRAAAGGRERAVAVSRATSRSVVVGGRAVASAARATGRATAPRVRRGALLVAALAMVLLRTGGALVATVARPPLAWIRSQGPELAEELLIRLGQSVGPLDGPHRRS
jgi:hypothetical protein